MKNFTEDKETTNLQICAVMLVLFFAGKFNQTQLALTLVVVNLLGKEMGRQEIPTTFNGCAKLLLDACDEEIKYSKEFYCATCDVMLNKQSHIQKKVRLIDCLICKER